MNCRGTLLRKRFTLHCGKLAHRFLCSALHLIGHIFGNVKCVCNQSGMDSSCFTTMDVTSLFFHLDILLTGKFR